MKSPVYKIAFFGSSLVSAYWNGAATYYRGIIKELSRLGHSITFFEPDAFERQQHRDMPDPEWAEVVVYPAEESAVQKILKQARTFDIVIKASGVGVFDSLLEREVLENRRPGQLVIFWDVDAPATLASMENRTEDTLKPLIPEYDLILTYGGGPPVVAAYEKIGARACIPINNALDPDTHHPVTSRPEFVCDLAFLGNRLPDREKRVDSFFLSVARQLPDRTFLLGGSGWETLRMPDNIRHLGHVYTRDHNAFNASPLTILNINRDSMAQTGYSPATRIFEAAGAGACIITDSWTGIDEFLEPEKEILVAGSGDDVVDTLESLTPERAGEVGRAALERVLADHTYRQRAEKVSIAFRRAMAGSETADLVD